MKRKTLLAYFFICGLVFVALMIVATFYDLQISKALSTLASDNYYSKNFFCVFFEIFGETPVYIILTFALTILFYYFHEKISSKHIRLAVKLLIFSISFLLNVYATYKLVGYFSQHLNFEDKLFGFLPIIFYCLGGLFFALLWLFFVDKFSSESINKLFCWSIIVVFTIFLSQLIVIIAKPIFARVRYRTMNLLGNFDYFSKWYNVNNTSQAEKEIINQLIGSDGYRSFPSGHTASAASTICLFVLCDFCEKFNNRRSRIITLTFSLLYTATVALSRIMIGAHYLSDVTIAATLTFLCCFIAVKITKKLFVKYIVPLKEKTVRINDVV